MKQLNDLLRLILNKGSKNENRTADKSLAIYGHCMRFEMKDGFPAPTNRKLAFKSMLGELLGFFRGYENAAQFRALGCPVWDANANETPSWLANPNRKGLDDLGKIYGAIWTDWEDLRVIPAEEVRQYEQRGYEVKLNGVSQEGKPQAVVRKGINQLEEALMEILVNPTSRRIIITGWRVDYLDRMALPPCHVDYCFNVDSVTKELHLSLWQRSFDSALAFNIQIGAVFLHIMAQFSGLKPGSFTHFISNAHAYEPQLEGIRTMLEREDYPLPTLEISKEVVNFEQFRSIVESQASSAEKRKALQPLIKGIFKRIEPEHFQLHNYQHHPQVKLPFSA